MTVLRPWVSTAALVLVWQVCAAVGVLDPRLLPGPWDLLQVAAGMIGDGSLPEALGVSTLRAAAGAAIGVGVGLATGLAAGLSRLVHDLVDRPLQAVRTVPFTALTPLLIVWFGLGEAPKVLLVVIAVAVPVYLTTLGGVRGVDPDLLEVARTYGLSRWRTVREVVLPGAMGAVLVGLRFALGVAWVALIVAEMVNADAGIGQLLTQARTYGRTDVVMVCVAVYAVLGLLTDLLVRGLEERVLRWRTPLAPPPGRARTSVDVPPGRRDHRRAAARTTEGAA